MSERASYSRVYWSIVDDPKFVTIYDSDAHLAAWLRLLLIADQAHPASAHLPANVRKSSVKALAECELIDLAGSRYRIHGLDAERERRRIAATSRPPTGGKRPPDGDQTVPGPDPTGSYTPGLSRGRDETRQAEPTAPATNDPYDDPEHEALVWLAKHGCDVRPGNGYHRKLVTAVEAHGVNAIVGMFDRLAAAGTRPGDVKGFLFGAVDALDARSRPKLAVLDAEDRADESAAARQRRVDRTRAETAELRAAIEAADAAGTHPRGA